jgi:hypothetical protein
MTELNLNQQYNNNDYLYNKSKIIKSRLEKHSKISFNHKCSPSNCHFSIFINAKTKNILKRQPAGYFARNCLFIFLSSGKPHYSIINSNMPQITKDCLLISKPRCLKSLQKNRPNSIWILHIPVSITCLRLKVRT